VQHLQEDSCHQLQLRELAALLGAFARLGYRSLVVEAMLQQLSRAAGCALARAPEHSSSSEGRSSGPGAAASGRGAPDPQGLVQLLGAYVQLGYHPGEVLLLSATVQLERQAQQLSQAQLEQLADVLEACHFRSSTFSRGAAGGSRGT
jgi:hypothetical protein